MVHAAICPPWLLPAVSRGVKVYNNRPRPAVTSQRYHNWSTNRHSLQLPMWKCVISGNNWMNFHWKRVKWGAKSAVPATVQGGLFGLPWGVLMEINDMQGQAPFVLSCYTIRIGVLKHLSGISYPSTRSFKYPVQDLCHINNRHMESNWILFLILVWDLKVKIFDILRIITKAFYNKNWTIQAKICFPSFSMYSNELHILYTGIWNRSTSYTLSTLWRMFDNNLWPNQSQELELIWTLCDELPVVGPVMF